MKRNQVSFGQTAVVQVSSGQKESETKIYRFGRFSAWPLGVSMFLLINAAAFIHTGGLRLAVLACAIIPLLVWFRLRLRLSPLQLEIRNLVRTSVFDLEDPQVRIWVDGGVLRAAVGTRKPVRAWGADGNKKSRNEGAVEKLEALCFALLQRTFEQEGAVLDFP